MKKFLILTMFAFAFLQAYSQAPTPPKGYEIKKLGLYTPGSGGNGNVPQCAEDDDKICILIRASTTTAYWNPLAISSATLEFPDYSPGTVISISSFSSTLTASGNYALSWTTGSTWVGPFAMSPSEYTVTVIP